MALINVRWPRDIAPETCNFSRTRNDHLQESPRTRDVTVLRQGRPLWAAECTWTLANTERLAKLRYFLEALDGFRGSVQVWDFSSPYPNGLNFAPAAYEPQRISWTFGGEKSAFAWQNFRPHWSLGAYLPLAAGVSAGDTEFTVSGLPAGSLVAVQGQYVQVGRRLYLTRDGVSADDNGTAVIPLLTPIISDQDAGAEVRFSEAACEMRLAAQDFNARGSARDGLRSVSASFIETVQDFE